MKNKLIILMGVTFISLSCFCGCNNKDSMSANYVDTVSNNKISGEETDDVTKEIVVPSEYDPTGVTKPIRFPEEVYPELRKNYEEELVEQEVEEDAKKPEVSGQNDSGEESTNLSGVNIADLPDNITDEGVKLNSLSVCHFPSDLPIALGDTYFSEDSNIAHGKRNISADTSLFSFSGKAYSTVVLENYILYFDISDGEKINEIYADCQFLWDKIEDGSEANIDYDRYQITKVNTDELNVENVISDNSANAAISDNSVEVSSNTTDLSEKKDNTKENEALEKELTPEEKADLLIQNRKDYLRQISIGGVSLGMTESEVKSVIGNGKIIDGLTVYKNKTGALIIAYSKDSKGYLGGGEFVYQIVYIANQEVISEE